MPIESTPTLARVPESPRAAMGSNPAEPPPLPPPRAAAVRGQLLNPARVVPIHTEGATEYTRHFPSVTPRDDGEWWAV